MGLPGLPHSMMAGFQEQGPKRTRWKVHCLLWVSLWNHIVSFLLKLQAYPDFRGGDIDSASWREECQSYCKKHTQSGNTIVVMFGKYNLPIALSVKRYHLASSGLRALYTVSHSFLRKTPNCWCYHYPFHPDEEIEVQRGNLPKAIQLDNGRVRLSLYLEPSRPQANITCHCHPEAPASILPPHLYIPFMAPNLGA